MEIAVLNGTHHNRHVASSSAYTSDVKIRVSVEYIALYASVAWVIRKVPNEVK